MIKVSSDSDIESFQMSPVSTLPHKVELYELKVESRGQNVTNPPFHGAQIKKHDHKPNLSNFEEGQDSGGNFYLFGWIE